MSPDDEIESEQQESEVQSAGDPSRAIRILAIDEEIVALEHVSPKARLYLALIIPLILLLVPLMLIIAQRDAGLEMLYMISPVLILVLVPTTIYGIEVMKNRRRLRRLEEELDKLIDYQEQARLLPGRAHLGGEAGGLIL
jgi:hypothetical protein